MKKFDLIIIGAGPAGLMSAIAASEVGAVVAVLEKNALAGRKLLLAGNGKCNITHGGEVKDLLNHYADKAGFVKPALYNFCNQDLIDFFENRGLKMTTMEDGKVFPETLNGQDVLKVLIDNCRKNKVSLNFSEPVKSAVKKAGDFETLTNKEKYSSKSLIVTTGGQSYPSTGSTGDGYFFAKKFGHHISELKPALTSIEIKDFKFGGCAGISMKNVNLNFYRDNRKFHQADGDILFTHGGLSGPAILDGSRYLEAEDAIKINCLPDFDLEEALIKESQAFGKKFLKTVLVRFKLPERLILKILESNKIPSSLKMADLNKPLRKKIVDSLTELTFTVKQVGDFNSAMVTRGGVLTNEINPRTMESKSVKGLYFAGEVVDVDADTGGYNLQWAFSSGFLAGKNAVARSL